MEMIVIPITHNIKFPIKMDPIVIPGLYCLVRMLPKTIKGKPADALKIHAKERKFKE